MRLVKLVVLAVVCAVIGLLVFMLLSDRRTLAAVGILENMAVRSVVALIVCMAIGRALRPLFRRFFRPG